MQKEFLVSHLLTALYFFLRWRYMEGECMYWVFFRKHFS